MLHVAATSGDVELVDALDKVSLYATDLELNTALVLVMAARLPQLVKVKVQHRRHHAPCANGSSGVLVRSKTAIFKKETLRRPTCSTAWSVSPDTMDEAMEKTKSSAKWLSTCATGLMC